MLKCINSPSPLSVPFCVYPAQKIFPYSKVRTMFSYIIRVLAFTYRRIIYLELSYIEWGRGQVSFCSIWISIVQVFNEGKIKKTHFPHRSAVLSLSYTIHIHNGKVSFYLILLVSLVKQHFHGKIFTTNLLTLNLLCQRSFGHLSAYPPKPCENNIVGNLCDCLHHSIPCVDPL